MFKEFRGNAEVVQKTEEEHKLDSVVSELITATKKQKSATM